MTGLFGMNFGEMAELEWEYGYHMFWIMVGCVTASILCCL
eukprot:COSAG01_NODE_798_length_13503_cov_8.878395_12_plen_40_part_00